MFKPTKEQMLAVMDILIRYAAAGLAAVGDGDENHAEESLEAKMLDTLVAIKERLKKMSAVEYLETREGMQHGTPIDKALALDAVFSVGEDNRRSVEIVRKWKEEQDACGN